MLPLKSTVKRQSCVQSSLNGATGCGHAGPAALLKGIASCQGAKKERSAAQRCAVTGASASVTYVNSRSGTRDPPTPPLRGGTPAAGGVGLPQLLPLIPGEPENQELAVKEQLPLRTATVIRCNCKFQFLA